MIEAWTQARPFTDQLPWVGQRACARPIAPARGLISADAGPTAVGLMDRPGGIAARLQCVGEFILNQRRLIMDITALPFNQLIGLTRSERTGALLSLPGDVRYTNHLGTIHAGALLALAENTSGECLLREFREVGFAVVPVVRRLEAKFRNPAHGRVHASANLSPDAKAEFLATFAAKGRGFVDVVVEVCDEGGTTVMTATVGWFIAHQE